MNKNQGGKILLIVQLPPPIHGASVMNSHIVNSEKINKRFNIEVINLQFSKTIGEISIFSIRKVFKAIYFGFKIINQVFIQKPDLVYFTFSPSGYAFYRDVIYVVLLKLLRRKIVFHLHGKGIKENKLNIVKKCLYLLVFRNTYVICLSKKLVNDIETVNRSVPYIIPNGIQLQSEIGERKHKKSGSVTQILFLSNYVESKGILILIDALKRLKNQGYNFKAKLVGAPSDLTMEFLNNLISDQDLSGCIQITGPLYGDAKKSEFQSADIFVFPTYYRNEAFPLVILEAMQYGLPIISTSEGAIPELVEDAINGFIIPQKDPVLLAERIKHLIDNPDLRIEMGERGYGKFINNYTLDHFENNMIKTFQDILSLNKSR